MFDLIRDRDKVWLEVFVRGKTFDNGCDYDYYRFKASVSPSDALAIIGSGNATRFKQSTSVYSLRVVKEMLGTSDNVRALYASLAKRPFVHLFFAGPGYSGCSEEVFIRVRFSKDMQRARVVGVVTASGKQLRIQRGWKGDIDAPYGVPDVGKDYKLIEFDVLIGDCLELQKGKDSKTVARRIAKQPNMKVIIEPPVEGTEELVESINDIKHRFNRVAPLFEGFGVGSTLHSLCAVTEAMREFQYLASEEFSSKLDQIDAMIKRHQNRAEVAKK